MIVVMEQQAGAGPTERVVERIEAAGFGAHVFHGAERDVIAILGTGEPGLRADAHTGTTWAPVLLVQPAQHGSIKHVGVHGLGQEVVHARLQAGLAFALASRRISRVVAGPSRLGICMSISTRAISGCRARTCRAAWPSPTAITRSPASCSSSAARRILKRYIQIIVTAKMTSIAMIAVWKAFIPHSLKPDSEEAGGRRFISRLNHCKATLRGALPSRIAR